MAMAGANPFAIMKALGHADIKTTMIYVSLGKSHIRDRVDRLNCIPIPKARTLHSAYQRDLLRRTFHLQRRNFPFSTPEKNRRTKMGPKSPIHIKKGLRRQPETPLVIAIGAEWWIRPLGPRPTWKFPRHSV
jgi:hypothetical protein